jgi:hypothetical protein
VIAELQPDDVKRDAGDVADARLAAAPVDALANAHERRQQPSGAADVPGAVELGHRL